MEDVCLGVARTSDEYIWSIPNFTEALRKAKLGMERAVYSEPFTFCPGGYRMAACIFPDGDGVVKGRYVSIFFLLMKGPRDNQLSWPFNRKVTLALLNQADKGHITDAFRPDPTSDSFQKPQMERNPASGCPLFCPLVTLLDPSAGFIKDDTIQIQITVAR